MWCFQAKQLRVLTRMETRDFPLSGKPEIDVLRRFKRPSLPPSQHPA